jgi:REP element-mobilizing transposase RayT
VSPGRPRRLATFNYVGVQRYFLTICTASRRRLFTDGSLVDRAIDHLFKSSAQTGFAVPAYCFMPDHCHALLVAAQEDADLLECVRRFKQMTAFDHRRRGGGRLWQAGYFERVLRHDEETLAVMRYILENPVRAALTRSFLDYPFSGSGEFAREQLVDLWQEEASDRI